MLPCQATDHRRRSRSGPFGQHEDSVLFDPPPAGGAVVWQLLEEVRRHRRRKAVGDAHARLGLSGRIAAIVRRYQALIGLARPPLSREQWCAVCDANNGVDDLLVEHPQSIGMMLWANVADTPGLGTKWDINQDALVETMRAWSYAEQIAAYETVRVFWSCSDLPTDEALREAGVALD